MFYLLKFICRISGHDEKGKSQRKKEDQEMLKREEMLKSVCDMYVILTFLQFITQKINSMEHHNG